MFELCSTGPSTAAFEPTYPSSEQSESESESAEASESCPSTSPADQTPAVPVAAVNIVFPATTHTQVRQDASLEEVPQHDVVQPKYAIAASQPIWGSSSFQRLHWGTCKICHQTHLGLEGACPYTMVGIWNPAGDSVIGAEPDQHESCKRKAAPPIAPPPLKLLKARPGEVVDVKNPTWQKVTIPKMKAGNLAMWETKVLLPGPKPRPCRKAQSAEQSGPATAEIEIIESKRRPHPRRASSSRDLTSDDATRPELTANLDEATASIDSCDALRNETK